MALVFFFFFIKYSNKLTSGWKTNLEISTLPGTADGGIWQKSVILHYLVDSQPIDEPEISQRFID